ncbi:hypothetical protein [Streptomyces mexicanus]|jgi:hypothetical protein|uniref:hypothetical protein n=1 Tax=Streptomyces mexicanus TaxID=178566 RepID=UPI0031EF82DE
MDAWTDAWDDGDCPWCRALLGAGPARTEPGAGRRDGRALFPGGGFHGSGFRGGDPSARVLPAHLLLLPLAVLTVLAALLVAVV